LTKAQWESIGWKGRQGLSDLRVLFDYQRPTADGRIVIGGSDAPYFAGDAPSSGNYRPALELLTRSCSRRFRNWKDCESIMHGAARWASRWISRRR